MDFVQTCGLRNLFFLQWPRWKKLVTLISNSIFFFLLTCLIVGQNDKVRVVQTLLFVEGINTLLQTLFGTRLPTVIGGSWAFMVPIISIIHDSSLVAIDDPHLVSINVRSPYILFTFGLFSILTPYFALVFDLHTQCCKQDIELNHSIRPCVQVLTS